MTTRVGLIVAILVGTLSLSRSVLSCPFCSAVSQTLSEEIASMDVVVITRLVEAPKPEDLEAADTGGEVAKSKFEVVEVIKGKQWLHDQRVIETLYFGQTNIGGIFLIMGADPPEVMWSTPLALSERAREYVRHLPSLATGAERLEFFQQHLEDEDEMLARDAYDEFAKAPYQDVQELKSKMDHDRLVAWIQDTDIPVSRRRLYLTMLGICGTASDIPMLQQMLGSEERTTKAGLDALIACYLMLSGEQGMPLVEELFLNNEDAEYADTYSAIMALRFHGTEADVIPRERLLEGLRYILERSQLADLVIPDLARWEDWSVMDRLVELFKNADDESSWVRVPVVNYLRACPLPEAKEQIAMLEKIDPEAVKRATTFFPFAAAAGRPDAGAVAGNDASAAAAPSDAETISSSQPFSEERQEPSQPESISGVQEEDPIQPVASVPGTAAESKAADGKSAAADLPKSADNAAQIADRGKPPASTAGTPVTAVANDEQINLLLLLGAPLVLAVILMAVLWLILRGSGRPAKSS